MRAASTREIPPLSVLDTLVAAALPVTPRFVVGRVARRYIAGETVDDAVATVRTLNGAGAVATVDVLGEFITDFSQARETAAEYEAVLAAIEREKLRCNVSVKLTALGLLIDHAGCLDLVRSICERAKRQGGFVRIDMEDSPVTQRTLDMVRLLVSEGYPVGAVLQAYLRRTLDDAEELAAEGISVRICKGIYREPPEIAYQDPEEIRTSYRDCLQALLEGSGRVGIAKHDEVLVEFARLLVAKTRTPRERYEFQMLLGVREWMRDELIKAGERVRIYVPFGSDWYGYSTRRLKENPKIAGHVFRAMLGFK